MDTAACCSPLRHYSPVPLMVHREPNDYGSVPLPASMQTLLDRYADRRLTSKERLVLAQAKPNVRCEALRIFFELNDARAGVEYVLANGVASPRSHRGSATTASACVSDTAASKALKLLSTNTLTVPRTVAKSHATVASAARRPINADAATARTLVRDKAHRSTDTSRTVVTVSRSTARSPTARAGSCSRGTSGARRGQSVCTVVTVSSMSSEGSGDNNECCPPEMAARERELQVDNPPTIALCYRDSYGGAEATITGSIVPTLPLDTILRQRGDSSSSFESSRNTAVLHGKRRSFVSPAICTAAANSQPRGSSRSAVPPPSPRSLSLTASEPSTSVTTAAPHSASVARPPLPPTSHEDSDSDVEQRKMVAAKPTAYYPNPAATLTAPVLHPKQEHNAAFKGARAMTVPSTHRCGCTSTFGYQHGNVEVTCMEKSLNRSRPFLFSTAQPLEGCAVASVCGTDWAALVAAARAPQLPICLPMAVTSSPTAAPASPRKGCQLASGGMARTTSTSSLGNPRPPTGKAHNQHKAVGDSESDNAPAAFSNSDGAGKTQQLQGALRVPCEESKRQTRASGKRSLRKAWRSSKGTARSSPPPSASQLSGALPIKRSVAWDETTGTYVTHPNQRRRQMATGCIGAATAATVFSTPRSAASLGAGASALETPDTLHYYLTRTASLTVTSGNAATGQVPALLTRMPTTTAAAHAAGSAPLGRLCSSALHLGGGRDVKLEPSSTAVLPLPKNAKKKKRARGPARGSTLREHIPTRKGAAMLTAPPRVAPIVASPRLTGYRQLCSGYEPATYNVYRENEETIELPRPALKYCTQVFEATVSGSPNRHPRAASAGPAVCPVTGTAPGALFERCCRKLRHAGVGVAEPKTARPSKHAPCPSVARTLLSTRLPVQQHPHEMVREPAAGMLSTRGSATDSAYQAPGAAAPDSAGLVPAAPCSVFERLTSNYYDVYSSATALRAARPPPATVFSRGGCSALKCYQPARRGRGHARRPATPQAVRHGCLGLGEIGEGESERTTVPPPRELACGRWCDFFVL